MRGRLIVLEGSEGVGKSTQIEMLKEHLRAQSIAFFSYREPGGTPFGDSLRRILLDPATSISSRAEALLFMASRAELVEREVVPKLSSGKLILIDRFFLSTYAYQIAGRLLPEQEVRLANDLARAGLIPDLTILLTAPSGERQQRADLRGDRDRMEQAGDRFHERVERAFESFLSPEWQQAHPECGPIVEVAATGAPHDVAARVLAELERRVPETFTRRSESLRNSGEGRRADL
ncbi:MAG: dTMP kinase [Gemmatimonadota bacterium]|nr:dTMP kinase [Gemmatimonadota bacterium]